MSSAILQMFISIPNLDRSLFCLFSPMRLIILLQGMDEGNDFSIYFFRSALIFTTTWPSGAARR